MEGIAMAKKIAAQQPASEPKRTVLTIKGFEEWKGWFERFADFLRTPGSTVVDHAFVRYAKEAGFKEEPPKRRRCDRCCDSVYNKVIPRPTESRHA